MPLRPLSRYGYGIDMPTTTHALPGLLFLSTVQGSHDPRLPPFIRLAKKVGSRGSSPQTQLIGHYYCPLLSFTA